MMMAWFDRVRMCVGWDRVDRARIAELRRWLDSDIAEMTETLGEQLVQFKGTQPLMANERFAQRFHSVLHEWLVGLLDGEFDGEYAKKRWTFGQKLMELEGVELEVTKSALKAIAKEAINRKTGARGLRAIIENIMLDISYEVPTIEGLRRCVITEEVVLNTGEPLYFYEEERRIGA